MAHTAKDSDRPYLASLRRGRRIAPETLLAIVFLLAGVAYRLYLTSVLPVGYDEVYVMSIGLDEMRESAAAALIEVPVRRSSGITPL